MDNIDAVLLLMASTLFLCVISHRLELPRLVVLVAGGVVLACLPGLPVVPRNPELVFQLFVPPLLYRAASQMSLREFNQRLPGIAFLSFTMVLATMAAVAWVATACIPGMGWAAAFALGAIVAPPDSVAALSLTRSIPLPYGVVVLLRGEGLVNDAAAFVSYRMAVAAMVTGSFSLQQAASGFVVAVAIGVASGLAVGWLVARTRERLSDLPVIDNIVSLLTPFLSFMPAERLGGSGVLAVVAAGLLLGRWAPRTVRPATRLQSNVLWETAVFLLESLIFVLVGYELPNALRTMRGADWGALAACSAGIAFTVMALRLLLVAVRPYVSTAIHHLAGQPRKPPPWSSVLLVGWAGVRGGESLVIALALPLTMASGAPLPHRDLIIFVTLAVIVITLCVQGLSFARLTQVLALQADARSGCEERVAREAMAAAGVEFIRGQVLEGELDAHAAELLRGWLRGDALRGVAYRSAVGTITVQRARLLSLHESGQVSDPVMRRLLMELDLLAALVGARLLRVEA